MNLTATYVDTYEFQLTPTSILRNCRGYYSIACNAIQSNGGPIFRTKFNQRSTWTMGDWLATYNWRFLSSTQEEPGKPNFFPNYSSIPAYNYLDVAVQWTAMKGVQLNLSISNLFDKGPPSVGNTIGGTAANSGNTFPQSYDVVGRFATIGLDWKF
jgi:outer membrane receptor protein involved in Fe transport